GHVRALDSPDRVRRPALEEVVVAPVAGHRDRELVRLERGLWLSEPGEPVADAGVHLVRPVGEPAPRPEVLVDPAEAETVAVVLAASVNLELPPRGLGPVRSRLVEALGEKAERRPDLREY